MTAKPVVPRTQAHRDVENAIDDYIATAGADVAMRFIASLEQTYRLVSIRPATGSLRFGHELDLPGLRNRNVKGFPYTVFYNERTDHIDLWRVLHSQRDIPAWLNIGGA